MTDLPATHGAEGPATPLLAACAPRTRLPAWGRVAAVVAHPDDESFGLGAVLAGFADAGARVHVLCLTHGEASTVQRVAGDLRRIRQAEFAAAARLLGIAEATMADHPDGGLAGMVPELAIEVARTVRRWRPDGLVVFHRDGVTGHPDHVAATQAALAAAAELRLPVLEWTLPLGVADRLNAESASRFSGRPPEEIDIILSTDRVRQLRAIAAHASQAAPDSPLWRRLDLLGGTEHLRLDP